MVLLVFIILMERYNQNSSLSITEKLEFGNISMKMES